VRIRIDRAFNFRAVVQRRVQHGCAIGPASLNEEVATLGRRGHVAVVLAGPVVNAAGLSGVALLPRPLGGGLRPRAVVRDADGGERLG
jgi:hypothetical protein